MATSSQLKTLIGGLDAEFKKALGECWDYLCNNSFAFGPIDTDAAQTKTTNLYGRYVKVTTSTTANQEVAVAHGLGRIPNVLWNVTSPRAVNSALLPLTITRAADEKRIYMASASTGVTLWLYLE